MIITDLIDVTIGCGVQDGGCKDGPCTLLEAGALGRLQTRDTHTVFVHDIELVMSAGYSRSARLAALSGAADFSRALGDVAAHSMHQGHVPAVIGGDHSCATGIWSGVADALRPRGLFGLIWIDAHLDSYTPQTSDLGATHGIPLAALLGYGAAVLTQIHDAASKLLLERVVMIGARSCEPAECVLFDLLGVHVIGAAEAVRNGLCVVTTDAIRQAKSGTVTLGMTLDLDAFDPVVVPGVGTPETDGLTAQGMA